MLKLCDCGSLCIVFLHPLHKGIVDTQFSFLLTPLGSVQVWTPPPFCRGYQATGFIDPFQASPWPGHLRLDNGRGCQHEMGGCIPVGVYLGCIKPLITVGVCSRSSLIDPCWLAMLRWVGGVGYTPTVVCVMTVIECRLT